MHCSDAVCGSSLKDYISVCLCVLQQNVRFSMHRSAVVCDVSSFTAAVLQHKQIYIFLSANVCD